MRPLFREGVGQMDALRFWFELECLLHIRFTTCNGARIFTALTLEHFGQSDGKVPSSPTLSGATYLSMVVHGFALVVSLSAGLFSIADKANRRCQRILD